MSTAITRWGNSSGVRIPSKVLGESRFKLGDFVDFVVNTRGNIEIIAPDQEHRRVVAPGRTTASELYKKFPVEQDPAKSHGWSSDDMVGAEWESWSS